MPAPMATAPTVIKMEGAPIMVATTAQTMAMAMAPAVPKTVRSHLGIVDSPASGDVATPSVARLPSQYMRWRAIEQATALN